MSKETKIGIDVVINNINTAIMLIEGELQEMKNSLEFLKNLKAKGVINNEK